MKTEQEPKVVFNRIISLLKDNNIEYKLSYHKPVLTMAEAEEISHNLPEEGIKTLLLKSDGKQEQFFLAVWRSDKKVNFSQIKNVLGHKVSMASPDEVGKILNVKIGGVTPFGYVNKIPVIFDSEISEVKNCYINPGVNDATLKLSSTDLEKAISIWTDSVIRI